MRVGTILVFSLLASALQVNAADWTRFRGPNGTGISLDEKPAPVEWSDTKNVKWKAELPGPGLSCPIIVGDRVVVTCWSGYAVDQANPGSLDDLKRNILCLDRTTGDVIWSHVEDPKLPEDTYRGMFAQNGYASHTPVTDGDSVFAFFGKTGVVAFDLGDGRKLWQKNVGEALERRGWGSASSPILHEDVVIVPAFIEGNALVAFDKKSGELIWEQNAPGYESNWSTPILVEAGGRTDLVLSVPGEVWGLNPATGKLRWYCEVPGSDDARASVVADGDVIVAMAGGRGGGGSIAIRGGGRGDVSESHRLWQGRDSSSIGTPVIHDGRLYVVNNKVVSVVDMKTGERISQARLSGASSAVPASNDNNDSTERGRGNRGPGGAGDQRSQGQGGPGQNAGGAGGRGGRGGFGGYGGGGFGGQDYSSPVISGDNLYYAARSGDVYVVHLGDQTKQIARNTFESDRTDYSATPSISNGEIFIRSSKAVYCIAEEN